MTLNNIKLKEKEAKNQNNEIELIQSEIDFKEFCKKYDINYKFAMLIGFEKTKDLLKRVTTEPIKEFDEIEKKYLSKLLDFSKNSIKIGGIADFLELIKINSQKKKIKIKKILVLGLKNTKIEEFRNIFEVFPRSKWSIANPDKDFKEELKNFKKILKAVKFNNINIYKGISLFNFTVQFGKFDLVIINDVYNNNDDDKLKIDSLRFIFTHFLSKKGLLAVKESVKSESIEYSLNLNVVRPFIHRIVRDEENNINFHYMVYIKKE